MFLLIPYSITLLAVTLVMVLPYYLFSKYLQKKLQPRKNGKNLLLYLFATILFTFGYMAATIYLVVWVGKAIS
jgi:hypothetical protein